MHDNAATCSFDWVGFGVQQTMASNDNFDAHFAASAQGLANMPVGALPLNLDEAVANPDMSAFSKFYDGAMCGAPASADVKSAPQESTAQPGGGGTEYMTKEQPNALTR